MVLVLIVLWQMMKTFASVDPYGRFYSIPTLLVLPVKLASNAILN